MASSPEVWLYLLGNLGFVATSGVLTGMSYLALRRHPQQRSYWLATVGFGGVLAGGVVEALFTLWFEPDFVLSRTEFLLVQAAEDLLVALGLGLLFYAVICFDTGAKRAAERGPSTSPVDAWAPSDDD